MTRHRKPGAFYRSNKNDVDVLTEKFYTYYRHKLFDRIVKARTDVTGIVQRAYGTAAQWRYADMHAMGQAAMMFTAIKSTMRELSIDATRTMGLLIRRAYVLSYLGDVYAFEKLGRRPTGMLTREEIDRAVNDDLYNSNYQDRVAHITSNLYRELERTLEQSMLMDETLADAIRRIGAAFGDIERIARSREAGAPARLALDMGLLDQEDIDEMTDEIRTVKGWNTRAPGEFTQNGKSGYEYERDLRTQIVRAVRTGRVDAAEYVGYSVKDYVWNAIVDGKTCECCCQPRDGLTMREIKAKFGDDKAPPLHYNCRCDLIPQDELLDEIWAEVGKPIEAEGFETWLKNLK